jgi:hypothetical protein
MYASDWELGATKAKTKTTTNENENETAVGKVKARGGRVHRNEGKSRRQDGMRHGHTHRVSPFDGQLGSQSIHSGLTAACWTGGAGPRGGP